MERLRKLRKENKITMRELGEVLGLSETAIYYYETGRREPDQAMLKKLADYFNVTVDYLLGRDTEKKNDDKKDFEERLSALGISKEKASKLTEKDLTLIYAYVKGLLDGKN